MRDRWWLANLAVYSMSAGLLLAAARSEVAGGWFPESSAGWWLLTTALHVPFLVISCFLVGGLIERLGFYWKGRAEEPAGQLPGLVPTVCVQLPLFNEPAVAQRVIEAAAAMTWPADRFSVQVLDDSSDEDTRALVEAVCAQVRASTGVDCYVRHRRDRRGYKAGALEEGRRETDAELLAIFDADFVPPQDFLVRAVPHFFFEDGRPDTELALVQAQWGHLNPDQSALTRAQSLWVDDHHTLQMSWRSVMWQFVNFTGTAGIWRASAIDAAGGWRAASLVEDCELSFRTLFARYRTKFVKEIVAPAELPATYTAYKAQQKRWTQGWAQLQRLHLTELLFRYQTSRLRRLHLLYHMCIPWQWAAWAIWIAILPFAIYTNHWFGALNTEVGLLLYLLPTSLWVIVSATLAALETKHTYPGGITPATVLNRLRRLAPYLVINTGMLPHQFSAFAEGLFGPLHTEFERTPKAGSVITRPAAGASDRGVAAPASAPSRPASSATLPTARKAHSVKVRWPYLLTEASFVVHQMTWAGLFAASGLVWCAFGAAYMASCVVYLAFFYGDHVGRVCFVLDPQRLRSRVPLRRRRQTRTAARTNGRAPSLSHSSSSAR